MDGIHGGPTVIDCRSTAGPTREKRTVTTRTFRFDVSVCLCCREASFRVFLSFFLPACIQSCKQTTAAKMMGMGMSFFHEPCLCVRVVVVAFVCPWRSSLCIHRCINTMNESFGTVNLRSIVRSNGFLRVGFQHRQKSTICLCIYLNHHSHIRSVDPFPPSLPPTSRLSLQPTLL